MYKDCIFFQTLNRILHIDRRYLKYLENNVSQPVWIAFCDKIDACFDPIATLRRRECQVRSIIIAICFTGWSVLSALWAVFHLFSLQLWMFGVASFVLLFLLPFGSTCFFIRKERRLLRMWPVSVQNICVEVSRWIPGTSFHFVYCDSNSYASYIEIMLGDYNDIASGDNRGKRIVRMEMLQQSDSFHDGDDEMQLPNVKSAWNPGVKRNLANLQANAKTSANNPEPVKAKEALKSTRRWTRMRIASKELSSLDMIKAELPRKEYRARKMEILQNIDNNNYRGYSA